MSIAKPTLHEYQTYEGRKISESKHSGYCGSCSLDLHIKQLNDYNYSDSENEWVRLYFMSKVTVIIKLVPEVTNETI